MLKSLFRGVSFTLFGGGNIEAFAGIGSLNREELRDCPIGSEIREPISLECPSVEPFGCVDDA